MPTPFRSLVTLALCFVPAVATGQGAPPSVPPRVAWWPRVPVEGSLVRVVVHPAAGDSVAAVSGEVAGEPLHFERFADGFRALGAVPFGARDSAAAHLVVQRGADADDTLLGTLRVARRRVPRERLRVAPQHAEPPESLAVRIRLE